jgi:hypothetical protein
VYVRKCLSGGATEVLVAAEEIEPRLKLSANRIENGLANALGYRIEWRQRSGDAPGGYWTVGWVRRRVPGLRTCD